MPRTARAQTGGLCCHVLNRGNNRAEVFRDADDCAAFVRLLERADEHVGDLPPMPLRACCLMPNHFHLLVQPRADGDLGRWMQWLMTSHVRRHHRRHDTSGHVWAGRFKSFVIQRRPPSASQRAAGTIETADPLWTVIRYVERNPLRAGLVKRAEEWPWSSLRWSVRPDEAPSCWHGPATRRPEGWARHVNQPQTQQELEAVRRSVVRGRPFGGEAWVRRIAARLGLEFTLRPRGRPPKRGQERAKK